MNKTVTFKMKLNPGMSEEYKKRHDNIWPELVQLLKQAGISDYSISLDEETNTLFGCYKAAKNNKIDELPHKEIMKNWWRHMKDIMETHPDNMPVSSDLKSIFYMD
ncbi:MAG: L-rhamnose mutarotase [Kordiimonadaceae bacterium]|jgi:L-rhamnose mutarotase|nr:L-rhamnose mutarotase [Kordiimonadaceae bacterium]